MTRDDTRAALLRRCGAGTDVVAELLAYGASAFDVRSAESLRLPLDDEPFAAAWATYARDAAIEGTVPALRRRLAQLNFPIAAGMSANPAYLRATRTGDSVGPDEGATGLVLRHPEAVTLALHPSAAGRIPVIVADDRSDFVSLLQALTRRNEPETIPVSMGACMVAGYVNWDRVAVARCAMAKSRTDSPLSATGIPRELYQDRFILLSNGDYSGVSAESLGLEPQRWRRLSLVIRREHECAHYFTRRAFGSMRNSVMDELVADYVGIAAAFGHYRAAWFLRFLGLDEPEQIRPEGRVHSYRGTPPLSERAFAVLAAVIQRAAEQLERFDRAAARPGRSPAGRAAVIVGLSHLTLEELALDGAGERLARCFRSGRATRRPVAGPVTERACSTA